MRLKLGTAALAAASVGAIALAAAPMAAADNISGCQLAGNATFDQPLGGTTSINTTYSFNGTVSGCKSSASAAPTDGTIEAGLDYLPKATLSGSCATSSTSGIAVVTWSTGTRTVVQYTTTGAAAAVGLTGRVIDKVDRMVPVTNPAPGQPATVDQPFVTNEASTPVGNYVAGPLAFQPPDPTGCGPTGSGVSSAAISGAIFLGNENKVALPLPFSQHHARGARPHHARGVVARTHASRQR